jgi:adenylyltransferase/sulfurtransferase
MRSVLVVGAGGLGCPALLALAPALAERDVAITIADDDVVDLSNLQRQILHRTEDVGRAKVDSAKDALERRWPRVQVRTVRARVTAENGARLVAAHDLVLDGTDSLGAKFLLNDLCVAARVPLVHGAVAGLTGQLMSILPGHACFRCLFESEPAGGAPSCQEAGVVGAFAGVIGALMAKEALAIVAGAPALADTLLVVDGASDRRRRVTIRPRPSCALHDFSPESLAC